MPGENNMVISFFFGKGEIRVDILICIGKTFIPRSDEFFLSGIYIHGADLAESVIGLRVNKIDPAAIEGIVDVVNEIQ